MRIDDFLILAIIRVPSFHLDPGEDAKPVPAQNVDVDFDPVEIEVDLLEARVSSRVQVDPQFVPSFMMKTGIVRDG
ncbi:hypothetical protein [Roseiarcus fermentans]|uniref:hypothetical protein n=1 Tax=Roseiarcus fermentans TaxID=1473586 RepID=UPI0011BE667A|nr:hypothetical protein [Roseiarcus fermentans]